MINRKYPIFPTLLIGLILLDISCNQEKEEKEQEEITYP